MWNNQYIEKVKNHPKILVDTEVIYSKKGNWSSFFGNNNNIILEIGTGLGNFFSRQVINNPNNNYIGIELKYKRLYKTREKSLGNIKNNDNIQDGIVNKKGFINGQNFILLKDFGENIDKIFGNEELSETYIFFPDPWDKNQKTLKHRMLSKKFLNDLYKITKKGGKFFFKTDHRGYFDDVFKIIEDLDWNIDFKTYDYEKDGLYDKDKITEFERIFRGQGLKINYREFSK